MTKSEELFHTIASGLPDAKEGKMFGALCVKAPNGKAGIMFWKDDMIFKLSGDDEKEALALKGAKVFAPMDGRAMNGWIQVPNAHAVKWLKYAESAMANVKKIVVKKKTAEAVKKTATDKKVKATPKKNVVDNKMKKPKTK